MSEPKKEAIRSVLRAFAGFSPGFSIEGPRLVIHRREKALASLRHHSLELLAPAVFETDDQTREALSPGLIAETVYQVKLAREAQSALAVLSGAGTPAVAVKGFALKRYYPADCLRPITDLDFLIRPEDRQACLAAFTGTGYLPLREQDLARLLDVHGEVALRSPHTGVTVELHWDMVNPKSMRGVTRFDPEWVFGRAVRVGVAGIPSGLSVLPVSLDLAYLMAHHVLHHQFKRLLWLADVLLILMTETVDPGEFEDAVRRLRIDRPVHYYLRAIEGIFGREGLGPLVGLRERLRPASGRYRFFSVFHPPAAIFRQGRPGSKWMERLFRNAFK